MFMEYEVIYFANFEQFKEENATLAFELLESVAEGDWMQDALNFYPSKEDFVKYELIDGWYSSMGFTNLDYNGAPNLVDYIDLDSLGDDLISCWDESMYTQLSNGSIISTNWGW